VDRHRWDRINSRRLVRQLAEVLFFAEQLQTADRPQRIAQAVAVRGWELRSKVLQKTQELKDRLPLLLRADRFIVQQVA